MGRRAASAGMMPLNQARDSEVIRKLDSHNIKWDRIRGERMVKFHLPIGYKFFESPKNATLIRFTLCDDLNDPLISWTVPELIPTSVISLEQSLNWRTNRRLIETRAEPLKPLIDERKPLVFLEKVPGTVFLCIRYPNDNMSGPKCEIKLDEITGGVVHRMRYCLKCDKPSRCICPYNLTVDNDFMYGAAHDDDIFNQYGQFVDDVRSISSVCIDASLAYSPYKFG